jgi:hypothetical protein
MCVFYFMCVLILSYVSSFYDTCVLILRYVSSFYYICVLILEPGPLCHLAYVCPHSTICVSSFYHVCVLILLHVCPHSRAMPVAPPRLAPPTPGNSAGVYLCLTKALRRTKPHCLTEPLWLTDPSSSNCFFNPPRGLNAALSCWCMRC